LLISSDMGVGVAARSPGVAQDPLQPGSFPREVRAALAEEVIRLVEPVMKPLRLILQETVRAFSSSASTAAARPRQSPSSPSISRRRHKVMLAARHLPRRGRRAAADLGEPHGCRWCPAGGSDRGARFRRLVEAAPGAATYADRPRPGGSNRPILMGELQKIVRSSKGRRAGAAFRAAGADATPARTPTPRRKSFRGWSESPGSS